MSDLSNSVKASLDPAGVAVCEWFRDHDGQRVEFKVVTIDNQSLSEVATVKADELTVDQGWVSIKLVEGEIGSPSEVQVPAKDEADGFRIQDHDASADALRWTDVNPNPEQYGGRRDFIFRVV